MRLPVIFQLRTFLVLAMGVGCGYVSGQNLVLNPGFEDHLSCGYSLIKMRGFTQNTPHWWTATDNDGYYFCGQPRVNPKWDTPRSGKGYVEGAIVVSCPSQDGRLFLQTKLAQPLRAGCTYRVSFYVKPRRRAVSCGQFAKGMGAYLSRNEIMEIPSTRPGQYETLIRYQPQVQHNTYLNDTMRYTPVSGTMVAQGGEEYLTIGFFMDKSALTCQDLSGNILTGSCLFFFQIDDVAVESTPPDFIYNNLPPKDTSLSPGDDLELTTGVTNTLWSTNRVGESIIVSKPGRYWYLIKDSCYTYTDTITVVSEELVLHIPNAFTPNNDGLNDQLEFWMYGAENFLVSVYDRWGQMIYDQEGKSGGKFSWDGKVNGREAMPGVYILQIIADGEQQVFEKVHLIK